MEENALENYPNDKCEKAKGLLISSSFLQQQFLLVCPPDSLSIRCSYQRLLLANTCNRCCRCLGVGLNITCSRLQLPRPQCLLERFFNQWHMAVDGALVQLSCPLSHQSSQICCKYYSATSLTFEPTSVLYCLAFPSFSHFITGLSLTLHPPLSVSAGDALWAPPVPVLSGVS